jgi:Predicted integral membrane protein
MAGIFGFFDYTKPGPGVPKDGPPKARIVVFFEVLQRKFWNLIKINLMFNIFNIPAVILGMFAALYLFPNIVPDAFKDSNALLSDILLKFILLSTMLCIPMVTVGPAQAGFTYVLRNYSREEHAFVWGDFKDNALKNFKQSMIVCGIDFIVTVLMIWSIRAYILLGGGNIFMTIGTTLMIMMFVIYMMMHMYMYPMLVTFKLSTKQLYKNALIFAIVKLFPNLGILLLCLVIIFLTFGMIIPFSQIIGIILFAFLTVSLIGMITNFYVYPKLQKYMMREDENEEEAEEEEEEEYEEEEEETVDTVNDNLLSSDNSETSGNEDGEEDRNEVKRYF